MNLFKMNKLYLAIISSLIIMPLFYSYAITPEQIIKLKKAGVSNKIIQIMLEQEEAGIKISKDKQGNIYIIYSSKPPQDTKIDTKEKEKIEKAWEILKGSIIDTRQHYNPMKE